MVPKHQSTFICIEGIDGSGKTTQARHLVKTLIKKGFEAIYTSEPSKGIYGELIRNHILLEDKRAPTVVEAVLFAADRLDHIEREIKPLLKSGKIVVCDRYIYSSIAYQGTSEVAPTWIEKINKRAIRPNLALYIDISPEIIIKRIRRRKTVMETFQTQKKVRELYLSLVKQRKLDLVAGDAPEEEVAEIIEKKVMEFLKHSQAIL